MATAIWTTFAVAIMVAIFAGCVVVVATGTRLLERRLENRRRKSLA